MFWYHHFGSLGHGVRVLSLAKAIKYRNPEFDVLVVQGGVLHKELKIPSGVRCINLSPLESNSGLFDGLKSPSKISLEKVKVIRAHQLITIARIFKPDFLITEHFPLGRTQFKFELIPLFKYLISNLPKTKIIASVRDFIDQEVDIAGLLGLLNYFSYVLVHSDPKFMKFDFEDLLGEKLIYTGYVASRARAELIDINHIRDQLKITDKKLVVVSIGGGIIGFKILVEVILAKRKLDNIGVKTKFLISTGPSISDVDYAKLIILAGNDNDIILTKFNPNLVDYINAADLNISMGGYNSLVNVMVTGTSTIIIPKGIDSEQKTRARKLQDKGLVQVLDLINLNSSILFDAIVSGLNKEKKKNNLNINGADFFAKFIEKVSGDN